MTPFKPFLIPTYTFVWTPALHAAFEASKDSIVAAIREGVEIFDATKRKCLRLDWSTRVIGYFLLQKHCSCQSGVPDCCSNRWNITLAGSRFLATAEQRYAAIEGEALAVAWGLEQTRYFTQGYRELLMVTDHKPLVKLFGDRTLDEITNTRLYPPSVIQIMHLHGKTNLAADATSRHPSPSGEVDAPDVADQIELVLAAAIRREAEKISTILCSRITMEVQTDDAMRALVRTVDIGFPDTDRPLSHPFWQYRDAI